MAFPDGTLESINNQLNTKARLLTGEPKDVEEPILLEAYAVYAEERDESERYAVPIMEAWSLVELSSTSIELALSFHAPLDVSSGNKPDLLLV